MGRGIQTKLRVEVFSTERATLGVAEIDGLPSEGAVPLDQSDRCPTRVRAVASCRSDGAKKKSRGTGTDKPYAPTRAIRRQEVRDSISLEPWVKSLVPGMVWGENQALVAGYEPSQAQR